MSAPFFIEAPALLCALLDPEPPILVDVRRHDLVAQSGRLLPASRVHDHGDGGTLVHRVDRGRPVVVSCAHGHNRSQRLAAHLRAEGFAASVLRGGYDAWVAAGLPTIRRQVGPVTLGGPPTTWISRRRASIDRVACCWLITRFLDAQARFLFTEPDHVLAIAADEGALAFDRPGAPFEPEGCTFDALLAAFGLDADPPLQALARIVRGADACPPLQASVRSGRGTDAGPHLQAPARSGQGGDADRFDLAPQSAGLRAVSLGLAARAGDDDHALLRQVFPVYDALYTWLREARAEDQSWAGPAAGRAA